MCGVLKSVRVMEYKEDNMEESQNFDDTQSDLLPKKNIKNRMLTMNMVKHKHAKNIHHNNVPDGIIAELSKFNRTCMMDELAKDFKTLYLSNDHRFQIKPKSNFIPINKQKTMNGSVNIQNPNDSKIKEKDANQNILKVDIFPNKIEHKEHNVRILKVANEINNDETEPHDDEISNLQSLLIMMALSPREDRHENDKSETIDIHQETDAIQTTKQNNEFENNEYTKTVSISSISPKLDNVDFFTVKPLKSKLNIRQETLATKYLTKWKSYVSKRKEHISEQRQETLNKFFTALENKKKKLNQPLDATRKAKLQVNDYRTYQHRYKMQRHIIALQRAKLEEQNRVIEELKYNKIIEASNNSVDALREEVRKTYYEVDRHLKPKIKCMTNELKIEEIQEPALILHCLKMPQFLQRMEKRAREREEKHALIRERRKQIEEERLRLKQQAEIEKAQMDNEEKLRRLKEMKEKRKQEKIENIRKKQMADRIRALTVMADLHYERTLMINYGIRPFRMLLQIRQHNMERAKAHYSFQVKKNVFLRWLFYTEDMCYERNYIADDFCRKKTLRKAFAALKLNHQEYVLKHQVAEDYYDLYVTQLVFRKFRHAIEVVKIENEIKWQRVVQYHNSILLFRTFTCWRTLPAINALQREQEARKAKWRQKVLQVVPDYTPPED